MSNIAETSRFPLRDRLRDFLDMARSASLDANAPAMGQLNNTAHPKKREDIEWTKRVDADGINAVLADFDTAEQISKDLDDLCQGASAGAASRCLKKIRAAFPKKSTPELLPGEDDYAQCRYLAQLYIHRTHIAARQHMFYTDHQRYHSIPLMLDTLAIDAITTIISEAERFSEPETIEECTDRLVKEGMTADMATVIAKEKDGLGACVTTAEIWRNMLGGIEYPDIDAACMAVPPSDQVGLRKSLECMGKIFYEGCPKSTPARLAVSTLNEIKHAWMKLKPNPLAPDTPLQSMEKVVLRVRDALACRSRMLLAKRKQQCDSGGKILENNGKSAQLPRNKNVSDDNIKKLFLAAKVKRFNGKPYTDDHACEEVSEELKKLGGKFAKLAVRERLQKMNLIKNKPPAKSHFPSGVFRCQDITPNLLRIHPTRKPNRCLGKSINTARKSLC